MKFRCLWWIILLIAGFIFTACVNKIAVSDESEQGVGITEFVMERVGDLTFLRPAHWGALKSQQEPYECEWLEFWDAVYDYDQPVFIVRTFPMDGITPTLDELLAGMLAEERIDSNIAVITDIIHPIDAAFVHGINIDANTWQYGMYEYNIRFVYSDWLYVITAWHSLDIDEHQSYILSMIQSLAIEAE